MLNDVLESRENTDARGNVKQQRTNVLLAESYKFVSQVL